MALYGYGGDWDSKSVEDLEAGLGLLVFLRFVCYRNLQHLKSSGASISEIRETSNRLAAYEKGISELKEYLKSRSSVPEN